VRYIKKIVSVFVLLLFLAPTVIKDLHHHKHFIRIAKNEKHFHDYRYNCEICKFEFSTYNPSTVKTVDSKITINGCYNNIYTSAVFIEQNIFSFSLRAPPLV